MQVNSVSTAAFKGLPNKEGEKTGGGGKAVASFFLPGLGQFLDGRNKEGAVVLGSFVGLEVAGRMLGKSPAKDGFQMMNVLENGGKSALKGSAKVKLAAMSAFRIAGLAHAIARTVDAYKGIRAPKNQEAPKA